MGTQQAKPEPFLRRTASNSAQGRGDPISLRLLGSQGEDEGDIPANCPSPTDLRTVGSWLARQYPLESLLDLIRSKDYTAAHELTGAHDAIQAIFQLADDLDEAQRDAAQAEEVSL